MCSCADSAFCATTDTEALINYQSHTRLLMNEVLGFWFGRSHSPEYGKVQKKWFEKNADFDAEVR